MRLDKFLCEMGIGTRSEVKAYLKKGQVSVNGEIIKKIPESEIINTLLNELKIITEL